MVNYYIQYIYTVYIYIPYIYKPYIYKPYINRIYIVFDGTETCELIGFYILSKLQHIGINVGLYKTPTQTEQFKKEICKVFSSNKLKLMIVANKRSFDLLDVTLDPRTGIHKPFMKPNNMPL